MVRALVPTANGSQRTKASPSRCPHSCATTITPTANATKLNANCKAIGLTPSQRYVVGTSNTKPDKENNASPSSTQASKPTTIGRRGLRGFRARRPLAHQPGPRAVPMRSDVSVLPGVQVVMNQPIAQRVFTLHARAQPREVEW